MSDIKKYSCVRNVMIVKPVLNIERGLWGACIILRKVNACSPPRKEKHIKTPTGKYVVPHEQISIVNPNGGNRIGIPEKESPEIPNPKEYLSWRHKELITRCQQDNSKEDTS